TVSACGWSFRAGARGSRRRCKRGWAGIARWKRSSAAAASTTAITSSKCSSTTRPAPGPPAGTGPRRRPGETRMTVVGSGVRPRKGTGNDTRRLVRVLELRCAEGSGGGPEKTILRGTARTDRQRFAVTVCYLRNVQDDAFDLDLRAAGLGLDFVEIHHRGACDAAVLPALRRLVRARGIDIIHAHDYKTNLLALLAARLDGVLSLSTAHGWTGQSWRERWA